MKIFPKIIPVFPLSGVIYFPKTNLPLNIFEQRYLDLVNDTYKKDKFMGMVQSQKDSNDVYSVGCLGKISDFQESKDGRILINFAEYNLYNSLVLYLRKVLRLVFSLLIFPTLIFSNES